MDLDLQFCLLETPPDLAILRAFRKDANAEDDPPPAEAPPATGKVQWIAIQWQLRQIGLARLQVAGQAFCFVSDLMILSQYRRRGIGRQAMAYIEQYALEAGLQRLFLMADEGTEHFYKSQAFVEDPLLPHLMRKDLICLDGGC